MRCKMHSTLKQLLAGHLTCLNLWLTVRGVPWVYPRRTARAYTLRQLLAHPLTCSNLCFLAFKRFLGAAVPCTCTLASGLGPGAEAAPRSPGGAGAMGISNRAVTSSTESCSRAEEEGR